MVAAEPIRVGVLGANGKVGQAIAWIASANDYYEHLLKLMKEGITIYSSPGDLKKRPLSAEKSQIVKKGKESREPDEMCGINQVHHGLVE